MLGFTLTADVPFGPGSRWVEVTPPGGGAAVALVPPQGGYQPGRMTGISLSSTGPARRTTPSSAGRGVDVDAEIIGRRRHRAAAVLLDHKQLITDYRRTPLTSLATGHAAARPGFAAVGRMRRR